MRLYFQAKRAKSKNKLLNEADRLQSLLLASLAKEKVVQQALGESAINILSKSSPVKGLGGKEKAEEDDLFKLPDLKEDLTEKSEWLDTKPSGVLNLHSIDVDSNNFKTLPADVRHEILTDIKETRKQNSWGRLHELPAHSDQFSSFQMQRLLKRRKVQVCLEESEKEMGGKSLSVRDLEQLLTEDGVMAASSSASHINSDTNTRFVMVSSIKKAMEAAVGDEGQSKPELGPEFDVDIQKAIQMSLNDSEVEEREYVPLTSKQKTHLSDAAKELARNYMMDFAGMSSAEVDEILGAGEFEDDINETITQLLGAQSFADETEPKDDDESSDSDLEEVVDDCQKKADTVLEVVIDPTKRLAEEDDLFADVFGEAKIEKESKRAIIVKDKTKELLAILAKISEEKNNIKNLKLHTIEEAKPTVSMVNKSNDIEVIDLEANHQGNNDSITDENEASEVNQHNRLHSIDDEETRQTENKVEENIFPQNRIIDISDEEDLENHEMVAKDLPVGGTEDVQMPKDAQYRIDSGDRVAVDNQKCEIKHTLVELDEEPIETATQSKDKSSLPNPGDLLAMLRQQKEEISLISLNDIKLDSTIIEISDSPPSTPSKKRSLDEYFTVTPSKRNRTPSKAVEDEITPSKVVKPFFVRKTPKSSEKKEDKGTPKKSTESRPGASKALFRTTSAESLKADPEEPLQVAADLLKNLKSTDELKQMELALRQEKQDLEEARNKQSRMGVSVTEIMRRECQDLLRLFGIPYICAPNEAEAQCAFLNAVDLTDGTITDDSDIWLFGGRTVYKNFFDQRKHVLEYKMETIKSLFHVDREQLIQLAMLVGSDYTTGINGVGAVTGLEILAQFPNTVQEPSSSETTQMVSLMSGLRKFREWWMHGNRTTSSAVKGVLRNKLKNITIEEGFPSRAVIEAYLCPTVDDSRAPFTWGSPDVETIREFATKNFGWTRSRTDELLVPVMKKQDDRRMQKSIKNYFQIQSPANLNALKVSKRVERAVKRMANPSGQEEVEEEVVAKTKSRRPKRGQTTQAAERVQVAEDSDCVIVNADNEQQAQVKVQRKRKPAVSAEPKAGPAAKRVFISPKERRKMMEEANRRKAIEIYKASKKG